MALTSSVAMVLSTMPVYVAHSEEALDKGMLPSGDVLGRTNILRSELAWDATSLAREGTGTEWCVLTLTLQSTPLK